MELQRVLESIKSGDFRSAMDCIKYLSQSIHDMQTAVLTVQDALAQKVDLVSKLDPLGSSSTTIGSGLVSVPNLIIAADGPDAVQTVMGTNTTFVTDFQSGWQIIINGITATIKTVASDILLTVICADLSTPIFPIESLLTYGIVRPSTTDMLIGEFA